MAIPVAFRDMKKRVRYCLDIASSGRRKKREAHGRLCLFLAAAYSFEYVGGSSFFRSTRGTGGSGDSSSAKSNDEKLPVYALD